MLTMFLEFFKTGLFAVGGGMATIPFLYEMARKYPWFSENNIADMIAISESTPGPIGVNMATYVGFNAFGVLGGIVATAGLILPSVIIMLIIAKFLDKFGESKMVKSAFDGIRPAVCALIGIALYEIIYVVLFEGHDLSSFAHYIGTADFKPWVLLIGLLVFMNIKKLHPIVYIGIAAVFGIVFNMF